MQSATEHFLSDVLNLFKIIQMFIAIKIVQYINYFQCQ